MAFRIEQVFGATGDDVLIGTEDIELDRTDADGPSLLVACQSRVTGRDEPGFIARVKLSEDGPVSWRRVCPSGWTGALRFHPIGISWVPETRRLYAVNRLKRDDYRIEVFDVEPTRMRHVETFGDPRV